MTARSLTNATRDESSTGPLAVYLAGRTEDRASLRDLRLALEAQGLVITSRWLDEVTPTAPFHADGSITAMEDIHRAHVFLLVADRSTHRSGTGGRHVESGIALAHLKPFVLFGEPENVFHAHPFVHVQRPPLPPAALARLLHQAAEHGTPVPVEVTRGG